MAPQLQPYDEEWLDEYRAALEQKYQGRFRRLFTFSQEESRIIIPDYTCNTVVIIKDGDRQTIRDVKRSGVLPVPVVRSHTSDLGLYRRGMGAAVSKKITSRLC